MDNPLPVAKFLKAVRLKTMATDTGKLGAYISEFSRTMTSLADGVLQQYKYDRTTMRDAMARRLGVYGTARICLCGQPFNRGHSQHLIDADGGLLDKDGLPAPPNLIVPIREGFAVVDAFPPGIQMFDGILGNSNKKLIEITMETFMRWNRWLDMKPAISDERIQEVLGV